MIELFLLFWMIVLPIIGIVTPIFATVFWVFIVPKVAKMLTYNRFRNVSIHAVGDDTGYVELVATREELPEGIVRTKKGWIFLPRPKYTSENPGDGLEKAERLVLRKYFLKDYGKPFWFGYAGKTTSTNPGTLAALQQTNKRVDLGAYFDDLEELAKTMPNHFKSPLIKKLKKLQDVTKAKPYTLISVDDVKQAVKKMYPPSLIDALAANRYLKGMKKAGKQYTSLIMLGLVILGIVALSIVAVIFLK